VGSAVIRIPFSAVPEKSFYSIEFFTDVDRVQSISVSVSGSCADIMFCSLGALDTIEDVEAELEL
jgi:hypothetical protein